MQNLSIGLTVRRAEILAKSTVCKRTFTTFGSAVNQICILYFTMADHLLNNCAVNAQYLKERA